MRYLRIFILIGILCPQFLFAEEKQLIKVAFSNNSPPTSFDENGKIEGIFKDTLDLIFSYLPQYQKSIYSFPWPRAQDEVKIGNMDLFLTYPSKERKLYADFMDQSIYVWDYGYLIYNLQSPKRNLIENAKSFKDLEALVFVGQEGVEWEKDNVPASIKRNLVNKIPAILHMVFRRNAGDFFIMSPDQAKYFAKSLGYEKQLGIKKVEFIPNSQVQFHIGIRKTFSKKTELMSAISEVLKKKDFLEKKKLIDQRYSPMLGQ